MLFVAAEHTDDVQFAGAKHAHDEEASDSDTCASTAEKPRVREKDGEKAVTPRARTTVFMDGASVASDLEEMLSSCVSFSPCSLDDLGDVYETDQDSDCADMESLLDSVKNPVCPDSGSEPECESVKVGEVAKMRKMKSLGRGVRHAVKRPTNERTVSS